MALPDPEHHRGGRVPGCTPPVQRVGGAELPRRLVDVDPGELAGTESRTDVVDALRAEQQAQLVEVDVVRPGEGLNQVRRSERTPVGEAVTVVGEAPPGGDDLVGGRRRHLRHVLQGRVPRGVLRLAQGGLVDRGTVRVVVRGGEAAHGQHLAALRVHGHRAAEVAAGGGEGAAEGVRQLLLQAEVDRQAQVESRHRVAVPLQCHRPSPGVDEEALLPRHAPQDGVVVPLEPRPADPLPHRQARPALVVLLRVGPHEADERRHQRARRVDTLR